MTTLTPHLQGTFCWPELSTTDPAAARKFYGGLFGWTVNEIPLGPDAPPYLIFQKNGKDVGAGYNLQPDQAQMGMPPNWGAYISVASADAAAAKAKQLGATVMVEPFDVMENGRMAVLQDPTGAVFSVWQARTHIGSQVLDEPGALSWTELLTGDPARAKEFYSKLIGWTTEEMDMGEMTYTLFVRSDGAKAAGLMKFPPDMQGVPAHWMSYFQTADIQKSAQQVTALGGVVHMPPSPVPNIGQFAIVADPQGATFGLWQPA